VTSLGEVAGALLQHYGEEPWWWPRLLPEIPREDELLLGGVLCQQSRWERVEQVLFRLRDARLLSWEQLAAADPVRLTPLLSGSAYPPTRARVLPQLAATILDRGGVGALLAGPDPRNALLALPQVGPETADVILAFTGTSVPVVDAYLRRVLGRLGIVDPKAPYAALREQLAGADVGLPWDVLHALLVEHGIHHCLTGRPRCDSEGRARRDYAEPRKCGAHCPPCGGCPLSSVCLRKGVAAPA
jgi:endonuclease-3 related protein